jgi:hypothetical protein
MDALLPVREIGHALGRRKCQIYADRQNGEIKIHWVQFAGWVLVGTYDHNVSASVLEDAAHRALLKVGK